MGINTNIQPVRVGMDIRDYVDEVKLRLHRLDVISDLNPALIASMVNQSRRDCQSSVLQYMPERFGKIVNYTINKSTARLNTSMGIIARRNGTPGTVLEIPLPDNLLDIKCVILSWSASDVITKREARSYVLQEMYEIGIQDWNAPTIYRPVYTVDRTLRQQATGSSFQGSYVVYLAGLDIDATQTLFDIADGNDINVEVWYTMAISDLEWGLSSTTADIETVIPTYLQEYVILQTLLKCLKYTKAVQHIQTVNNVMQTMISSISEMYIQEKKTVGSLLPSREPM